MRKKYVRNFAVVMALTLGATTLNPVPLKAAETTVSENPLADTDKDGLQDYLEDYFGTDKTKSDTDEDGISDFVEIMKLKSDPLKKDSDGDADQDGLSNLLEIQKGTNPMKADTDGDGLSDAEEINIYHTSPLLRDSDGDGLLDGEEVELNLSPLKKYTKAIEKDCHKLFSQVLKLKNIEEILRTGENLAIPSLSGDLPGLMERRVTIGSSTIVLDNMESYTVGMPIEIVSEYQDSVNMKLSFTCLKSTLKQVKNYKIAHYKDGEVTYLDTKVFVKTVSANITEGGTYFVVNEEAASANVLGNSKTTARTSIKSVAKRTVSEKTTELEKSKAITATALAAATDTDYDGIADSSDPKPNDNSFVGTIKNSGFDIDCRVTYAIDYRAFFKTPSTFSSQLCKASSVYANMAYEFTMADQASGKTMSFPSLMSYQGLSNVTTYNLENSYSDNDVAKFFIGHRTVTYNGTTKDIIAISVKGTGGGIKQWASNFDIGTTSTFSSYADWTTSANHKGFDIAATRVKKAVDSYVSTYCSGSNEKAYWVVGHSRGGAVANILAAKLKDSGKTAYGYTFACPNTTTKSATTAAGYTSIFNIVNKDDFVPYLPCSVWGFRRYGKTSTESIADKYEKEWEDLTGISDYNPDTFGMEDTITKLGGVFSTRNKAYVYTCPCHGDGSKDDITIRNKGMSKDSREKAIAKIPSNCLPYCKITRYTGSGIVGWDFECCQTPSYFMQDIAAFMAGTISTYRFVTELNVADHYESAKSALISSGIGGLEHPHYSESYYLLAKHAAASNFS